MKEYKKKKKTEREGVSERDGQNRASDRARLQWMTPIHAEVENKDNKESECH